MIEISEGAAQLMQSAFAMGSGNILSIESTCREDIVYMIVNRLHTGITEYKIIEEPLDIPDFLRNKDNLQEERRNAFRNAVLDEAIKILKQGNYGKYGSEQLTKVIDIRIKSIEDIKL